MCFNTQPPKGGWYATIDITFRESGFNTQPPKGGWNLMEWLGLSDSVSTHSRLKAAGTAAKKSPAPY